MADLTIRAIIKLLVEGGHIPKEVADGIKGVGNQAKETKKDLGGLGQASKDLGGMLSQYLGAAALGGVIRSSVVAFADLDRQFSSLGRAMNRIGLDGTADLGRARTELEALALSGGPLQSQTIPAMQKFVTMTRDTDKALAAVKLASDISESGITDFGTAASGVASLLQGRVKVAATQFGIDLTDLNGKAKSNADLIREIEKVYGGLGDAFNDAANDLDTLNAQWESTKQIVGEGFAPLLKVINWLLFQGVGLLKDVGAVAGAVFNEIIDVATGMGASLRAAFDFKLLATDPAAYFNAVKKASSDMGKSVADDWKYAWGQIVSDHTMAAAKVGDTTKGLADLIKQATKATAEEDAKAAADAAQKRLDIEHKAAIESLQAQIQAAEVGSNKRLSLEMDLLDEQEQAAVENAKRTGANVDAIRSGFELQRIVKGRAFAKAAADADYEAESERLRASADLLAEGSQERLDAELAMLDREKANALATFKGTEAGKAAIEAEFLALRAGMLADYLTNAGDAEIESARLVAEAIQAAAQSELDLRVIQAELLGESTLALHQQELDAKYDADALALAKEQDLAIANSISTHESLAEIDARFKAKKKTLDNTYAVASIKLVQTDKDSKIAAAEQYVAAASALGNAAFGHSKALMVAEAIAATALAVVKALPNYVLAALVAATGAVSVAKILSVHTGSNAAATHASDGTIVPASASKSGHPGKPKGTDTVAAWLTPGEIVTPAGASADVLSGDAVLMAPSAVPKGAPSKRIVGGKLAVVPADAIGEVATVPGGALRPGRLAPAPGRPGAPVTLRAAEGALVEDRASAAPGGVKGMISPAAEWFRAASKPVPDAAAPQIERSARPAIMIGGGKFSSALMPRLGGASFGGSTLAMRSPADRGFREIKEAISAMTERLPDRDAAPVPANVTNTVNIGTAFGDRQAMTKLAREINRVNANNQGNLR